MLNLFDSENLDAIEIGADLLKMFRTTPSANSSSAFSVLDVPGWALFTCALFTCVLFTCVLSGTAEAQTESPTPTAVEEDLPESPEIRLATPTPEPIATHQSEQVVEPLDAWVPIAPVETPTPLATPKPKDSEETPPADSDVPDAAELESVETNAVLPEDAANQKALSDALHERRIQLTKTQRARLKRARIARFKVYREQEKALGINESAQSDPRGEPELRVCTANLNYFGGVDDFKRVFKAAKLPLRKRRERSTVTAATAMKCDVLALQGILARDDKSAKLVLSNLAKKLSRETGSNWTGYPSEANRDIVRNGFLIRDGAATVESNHSYTELKLTSFGPFQLKQFPRSPFEILLTVPGKGKNAQPKKVMLLNFDFAATFGDVKHEPETNRMQISDGLRQIVHTELANFEPEEAPVVLILGHRSVGRVNPGTQLLEGKLRLAEFTSNGGCVLTAENKTQCRPDITHYKEFFGVSSEGFLVKPIVKTERTEEGEKRKLVFPSEKKDKQLLKQTAERTAEIYTNNESLDFALEKFGLPGRYKAGTAPLQNELPNSPLIWLELNW